MSINRSLDDRSSLLSHAPRLTVSPAHLSCPGPLRHPFHRVRWWLRRDARAPLVAAPPRVRHAGRPLLACNGRPTVAEPVPGVDCNGDLAGAHSPGEHAAMVGDVAHRQWMPHAILCPGSSGRPRRPTAATRWRRASGTLSPRPGASATPRTCLHPSCRTPPCHPDHGLPVLLITCIEASRAAAAAGRGPRPVVAARRLPSPKQPHRPRPHGTAAAARGVNHAGVGFGVALVAAEAVGEVGGLVCSPGTRRLRGRPATVEAR
jgi:hypothetical protein